jgi:hypothetical protein
MAFMLKKKRYKFQVELQLDELNAVTFPNAVLFSKIRLLDGGNFCEISSRSVENVGKWFFCCCGLLAKLFFHFGSLGPQPLGIVSIGQNGGLSFHILPHLERPIPKTEHFSESKSELYCCLIYVSRTLIRLFATVGIYAAAVYESKEQSSRW